MKHQDTATHYFIQVGPVWHKVDRRTGHHVPVDREPKLPDTHVMVEGPDGLLHLRREQK